MLKSILIFAIVAFGTQLISAQEVKISPVEEQQPYTITEVRRTEKLTTLIVNIKDESGLPMLGYVRLVDEANKPILSFFSDKNGFALLSLYDVKFAKAVVIDYLGYTGAKIPISKLKDKETTVTVNLKGQSTRD